MPNHPKIKIRNKNFARTKIVCTLGPASESKDMIEKLIHGGLDVARLNFSHNSHQWHKEMYDRIRSISDECTILFDLQGPKIRIGELTEPQFLIQGEDVILTNEDIIGDKNRFSVSLKNLYQSVRKNDQIYINDGIVGLRVKKIAGEDIVCKVISSGEIRSRKGVNVPNKNLDLPCLTQKDLSNQKLAANLLDIAAAR
ncbi:MAG: pyruvate kinase [Candidatus Thorarchaeota archaeon]